MVNKTLKRGGHIDFKYSKGVDPIMEIPYKSNEIKISSPPHSTLKIKQIMSSKWMGSSTGFGKKGADVQ